MIGIVALLLVQAPPPPADTQILEAKAVQEFVLAGFKKMIRQWDGDVFNLMSDRIPYRKGKFDMPEPAAAPAAAPAM